jgi:hypothetical protein
MGVGHHPCHHLYRLIGTQPEPTGASQRLASEARRGVPSSIRRVLAARVAAGESLRSLAREYGVSYETIRRARRAAELPA